jgi:threonine/homoserine/homoserine lactone efflux protein
MNRILELAAGHWAPFDSPLLAFILTSLIIEMTPGPNMAYLAVLGASRGRIAGFSAVLGVALGLALLGIAVGLGAGSLILNNRLAYESLRWAGALYLCWLAYDSWKEGRRPAASTPISPFCFVHFRRGFVSNILNPKAALFFIAVVPEFLNGPVPTVRDLSILVSIYVRAQSDRTAGQCIPEISRRAAAAGDGRQLLCCSASRDCRLAFRERRPLADSCLSSVGPARANLSKFAPAQRRKRDAGR